MDNLIITILIPVLLILITAFIGSIISRHQNERQIFNEGAKEFIKAFEPELEKLLGSEEEITDLAGMTLGRDNKLRPGIDFIFKRAFGRHQTAVIKFSNILGYWQNRCLMVSWKKYCKAVNSNTKTGRDKKHLLIIAIRDLFKTAKYK